MLHLFSSTTLAPQASGETATSGLLAAEAGGSGTAAATDGFAQLLNAEAPVQLDPAMAEMLGELEMLLSAEDFTQLEEMLAEGQILPVEEILAALKSGTGMEMTLAEAMEAIAGQTAVAQPAEVTTPAMPAAMPPLMAVSDSAAEPDLATDPAPVADTAAIVVPVPMAASQVAAIQAANRKAAQPAASAQPVGAGPAAAASVNVDGEVTASQPSLTGGAPADPGPPPSAGSPRLNETLLAQVVQQKTSGNDNLFRTTEAGLTAIHTPPAAPSGTLSQNMPQPAALQQLNSMLPIHTPVGEKGWDQAMGERILWMVGRQVQGAELRVTPPQLGPVEIRISIRNDQANVTFTTQHAVVREALEASMPRLREMLNENNLQLASVDVNQRNAGEGRPSPHPFHPFSPDGQGGDEGYGSGEEELPATPLRMIQSDGLVDDFA